MTDSSGKHQHAAGWFVPVAQERELEEKCPYSRNFLVERPF
jgi:hypothetical protein